MTETKSNGDLPAINCALLKDALPDFGSPLLLYKVLNKNSDWVITVGMRVVRGDETRLICNSDLPETWDNGESIVSFLISLFVDRLCEYTIDLDVELYGWSEPQNLDTLQKRLYEAVEYVEYHARGVWAWTHGCEKCFDYWESIDEIPPGKEYKECIGHTPVWEKCKGCGGKGIKF